MALWAKHEAQHYCPLLLYINLIIPLLDWSSTPKSPGYLVLCTFGSDPNELQTV